MKNLIIFILSICLNFSVQNSVAQNFSFETMDRPWSIELGVGPGWIYADNGGSVRNLGFSLSPAASVSLTKKINPLISLRSTIGFQSMQGNLNANIEKLVKLGENGNAYHFNGQAYYFDVAPVFRLFRSSELVYRRKINLYASTGVGVMGIVSTNDVWVEGESVTRQNNMIIPYIPLRGGISYKFRPLWDLSFEGSLLLTFNDDIDGNTGNNLLNDYPMNVQVKVRKFFSFKLANPLF
ncbi:MAG TPA: hypothetical protein VK921_09710 [Anditalea sp.]|nr:hypothetical protein [Anditalea sp.]